MEKVVSVFANLHDRKWSSSNRNLESLAHFFSHKGLTLAYLETK